MVVSFFALFVFFFNIENKCNKIPTTKDEERKIVRPYKSLKINKIKGQLSEKIKKNLECKYWKNASESDSKIDIEYEIFEFLDFLYIRVKIVVDKRKKTFAIKHPFSKNEPWRYDFRLIEKISQEINYKAQKLANT